MLDQPEFALPESVATAAGTPVAAAFFTYRSRWKDAITARMRAATATQESGLGDCIDYCLAREGKLIRPVLTLVAAELAQGSAAGALDYACAIELTHRSSLLLDDLPCMDDSDQRSGRTAVHVKFGEAQATLAAVFLLCTAFRLVAQTGAHSSRAVGELAGSIADNGMIAGQVKDLLRCEPPEVIRDLKSGALMRAAAVLGVLSASDDGNLQRELGEIARGIGLIFQMRDDVIDGQAGHDCQARAVREANALAARIGTAFGDTPASAALRAIAILSAIRAD